MADQPLIDISPENWRIVRDILQRYVPDREVWAFGSRARWTAKEFSDLDIVIIGDEPMSISLMADLREAFQESALPFKIDIVDWAAITPSFRQVIHSHKVSIQSGQGNEYRSAPLAELIELVIDHRGKTPKKLGGDFSDIGVPVLSAKHVKDGTLTDIDQLRHVDSDMYKRWMPIPLKKSDVLLTSEAPLGELFYLSDNTEYVLGQRLFALRTKQDELYPRYLYYFLKSATGQSRLHERATGTTAQGIRQSELMKVLVDFPISTDEQVFVADLLGALDEKVALVRETNATLEAIAQALFKSWFVDFDPVRAKADGREPDGVPPEVAKLFPCEFEESELGEIPKGWTVEPFGKLLEHAIGGDWGKDEVDGEHSAKVAVIRGTDIPDIRVGNLDGVPRRYVSPKKLKSRRLQDGDIVIEISGGSKTQATGRSLYCTDSLLDGFVTPVVPASFCRLFRPADKYLGILLAIHLSSIYAAGKMWNYQVQSTGLANFQTTHFLESELVVVPPEPIRETFFDLVRPLIERQQAASIRTTASLRDALLPRLMSGQLNPVEADS